MKNQWPSADDVFTPNTSSGSHLYSHEISFGSVGEKLTLSQFQMWRWYANQYFIQKLDSIVVCVTMHVVLCYREDAFVSSIVGESVAIYSSSAVRSRFAIVRRLSVGEGGAEAAGENTPSPESFSCTSSEAKNV
jgi:hypothetical protein